MTYVLPNVNTDDRNVGFKKIQLAAAVTVGEEITKELTRTE